MSIPVVYEDDWLLVVNKPRGLLSIPAAGAKQRTLVEILNSNLSGKRLNYRLHPCHRLDKQTSGLLILAKGKAAQQKMMAEFKKKTVKKRYLAYIAGCLPKAQGAICKPIAGKPAVTYYRVLRKLPDFSVVEVYPRTGRKNQIRLHFRQIGHPVIGEDKFAYRRDFKIKANRLCLHAQALDFFHPLTRKHIQLKAETPEYLFKFLNKAMTYGAQRHKS